MSDIESARAAKEITGKARSAGEGVSEASRQARQAGADAVGKARDVAGEAASRGASVMDAVGEQATTIGEAKKADVADRMDEAADAIHRSGEQLEGQSDWIAKLVEEGADELGSLANMLRNNDLRSLLDDLGGMARRQPALFVGASMVAGFALTRVGRVAASQPGHSSPAEPATGSSSATVGDGQTEKGEADRERH